jgi:hypothetical protein
MRKISFIAAVVSLVGALSVGEANAGGGMGDPSVHMRDMNALCDRQLRGEAPPGPSACLPDVPLGPDSHGHDLNHQES